MNCGEFNQLEFNQEHVYIKELTVSLSDSQQLVVSLSDR